MQNEEQIEGWYSLALNYFFGENGKEENNNEAIKWFEKAALAGHPQAQYRLGECYDKGFGVEMDNNAAAFWYAKAALNGCKDGKSGLRRLKWYISVKPWKKLAEMETLAYNEKAATAKEFCALGYAYAHGNSVEQDYQLAVACYCRAAWLGDVLAANNLGWCFEYGNGVDENMEIALWWYLKAANAGNALAQCNLGRLYYYGTKLPKDYEKALTWLKKSANSGNSWAMYELGIVYAQGLAIQKNYTLAKQYFLQSKEKGYDKAQSGLNWLAKLEAEQSQKEQAKTTATRMAAKPTPQTTRSTSNGYISPSSTNARKTTAVTQTYEEKLKEERRLEKERQQKINDEKKRRQEAFKRFRLDLSRSLGSNFGERLLDSNYSFVITTFSEECKVVVRAKIEVVEFYFRESTFKSIKTTLTKYIEKSVNEQMTKAGFSESFKIELSVEFSAR